MVKIKTLQRYLTQGKKEMEHWQNERQQENPSENNDSELK